MNTQGDNFNQNNHSNKEKVIDNRTRRDMEEEIEILREQVESLNQMLSHEYKVTNKYVQELADTKRELELMNEEISNLMASGQQQLDEANELDESLVEKKTVSDSITNFFSPIARLPVKLNEFKQIQCSKLSSRWDKAQSAELMAHSRKLRVESSQITSKSENLMTHSREILVHCRDLMNRCDRMKVSLNALHSPRCSPTGNSAGSRSGFLLEARSSRFPLDSQRKAIASATPHDEESHSLLAIHC